MTFKTGEVVRFKTMDEYRNEGYTISDYGTVEVPFGFITEMQHLCGRTATVKYLAAGEVVLDDDFYKAPNSRWGFSPEMFVLVGAKKSRFATNRKS